MGSVRLGWWIAAGFVAANLVGLDRSPVVWRDEVGLNDPAKELARHGVLRSSVFAGHQGYEDAYFWQPPGQALVTAAVYRLCGFGIWQTRIPPLLFGAAALALVFALGLLLLQDRLAAVLGAVVLALDPKYLQLCRSARMDPQALFLLLAGTLVLLGGALGAGAAADGRRAAALRPLLAGLLIGLAGITHPVAIGWGLGLGLLCLALARRGERLPAAAGFALGAAAPPLAWLGHTWLTGRWDLWEAQFLGHGGGHLAGGSLAGRLGAETVNYWQQYRLAPLLLLLYAAALPWLLWRWRGARAARLALAVPILVMLSFDALVMTKGLGYYYLYPAALLAIAAGGLLAALLRQPAAGRRRLAMAAAALLGCNLLAAGLAGRWLSLAWQWRERSYAVVEEGLRPHLAPGGRVWGAPEIWYAVERAGASLSLVGEPDPRRHDLLVVRAGGGAALGERARRVASFGAPLPPILGVRRPSADYTFEVWKWR